MKARRFDIAEEPIIVCDGGEGSVTWPKSFFMKNVGASSVYVGGDDLTVAQGYEVAPAEGLSIDMAGDALWAVCAEGDTSSISTIYNGN